MENLKIMPEKEIYKQFCIYLKEMQKLADNYKAILEGKMEQEIIRELNYKMITIIDILRHEF